MRQNGSKESNFSTALIDFSVASLTDPNLPAVSELWVPLSRLLSNMKFNNIYV